MIRIGVISDTHIPDRAKSLPDKILADFKHVDIIVHAGDLVELSVLEQLRSLCKNVRAVWGNMDPYDLRLKLPEKEIIEAGQYRIGIMHGQGHPEKLVEFLGEKFKDDRVDVIIFGHSHTPFNEKKGNVLYFNPGSSTDKVFSPYNSYGIIEIDDKINAKIIKL